VPLVRRTRELTSANLFFAQILLFFSPDPVASRGSVPVDSIAMHRPTAVSVPLAVGEKADGSVLLEVSSLASCFVLALLSRGL